MAVGSVPRSGLVAVKIQYPDALTVMSEDLVNLRAISAFQEGTTFARPFESFIEKVNASGKGLIKIDYIGGPKAMPPSCRLSTRPSMS